MTHHPAAGHRVQTSHAAMSDAEFQSWLNAMPPMPESAGEVVRLMLVLTQMTEHMEALNSLRRRYLREAQAVLQGAQMMHSLSEIMYEAARDWHHRGLTTAPASSTLRDRARDLVNAVRASDWIDPLPTTHPHYVSAVRRAAGDILSQFQPFAKDIVNRFAQEASDRARIYLLEPYSRIVLRACEAAKVTYKVGDLRREMYGGLLSHERSTGGRGESMDEEIGPRENLLSALLENLSLDVNVVRFLWSSLARISLQSMLVEYAREASRCRTAASRLLNHIEHQFHFSEETIAEVRQAVRERDMLAAERTLHGELHTPAAITAFTTVIAYLELLEAFGEPEEEEGSSIETAVRHGLSVGEAGVNTLTLITEVGRAVAVERSSFETALKLVSEANHVAHKALGFAGGILTAVDGMRDIADGWPEGSDEWHEEDVVRVAIGGLEVTSGLLFAAGALMANPVTEPVGLGLGIIAGIMHMREEEQEAQKPPTRKLMEATIDHIRTKADSGGRRDRQHHLIDRLVPRLGIESQVSRLHDAVAEHTQWDAHYGITSGGGAALREAVQAGVQEAARFRLHLAGIPDEWIEQIQGYHDPSSGYYFDPR